MVCLSAPASPCDYKCVDGAITQAISTPIASNRRYESKFIIVVILFVLGLAFAVAQGCPSTVCQAKFDNAYPAPTDCCVHDYKSTPKCSWGGTPVSWTRVRTCSSGGGTYSVLARANFQGPPGSSAECRCGSTVATSAASQSTWRPLQLSPSVTLKPVMDKDMSGSNVACNGQSFCKVCGGLEAVRAACAKLPAQCRAFTFNPVESCGYLKSAAGALQGRTGWVSYM
ncbi:hypothetical protein COO60DRAFT_577781 [Scenedesmus sp. NREL 46B-D3]|nr:hypothetical protein COO60DRAFT_577781 [Scenedesmus sp. NREL 46B-D3]